MRITPAREPYYGRIRFDRSVRSGLLALLLTLTLLLAPLGVAHEPRALPVGSSSVLQNWALGWAHYAAKPGANAKGHDNAACFMGDVDGDGHMDLLVKRGEKVKGIALLELLAGPLFERKIWIEERGAHAKLACMPDVQGDGTPDPLVTTVEPAESSPLAILPDALPLGSTEAREVEESLDGSTGEAVIVVEGAASGTSAAGPSGVPSAERSSGVDLAPVRVDVVIGLEGQTTEAALSLPAGDVDLAPSESSVSIEILDASGAVQATIEPMSPREEFLAVGAAPAAEEGALVLVVSAMEPSPFSDAAVHSPVVTAYDASGEVQWQHEEAATSLTPILIPQAGDVDGDAVNDIIVEMVPTDVSAADAPSVTVLSGATGEVLVEIAAEGEIVAALPFGEITPGGTDAILVIEQEAAGGSIGVQAFQGDDERWTLELPTNAQPVNGEVDEFTGDIRGFSDLTGDAVPDLAVVGGDEDHQVTVFDGATGEIAWLVALEPDAIVQAVPSASGAADLVIVAGASDGGAFTATRLDGPTGEIAWTSAGTIEATAAQRVEIEAAPVVAGASEAPDLLLSFGALGGGDAAGSASGALFLVKGDTGVSPWTSATEDGAAAPAPLESSAPLGREAKSPIPLGAWTWLLGITLALAWRTTLRASDRRR